MKNEPTPTNLNLACMPFDEDGNPVNQPEFMLEPNALITGSAYFRTAPEEMFESVSFIVCANELDAVTNKSINVNENILNCFFILLIVKENSDLY